MQIDAKPKGPYENLNPNFNAEPQWVNDSWNKYWSDPYNPWGWGGTGNSGSYLVRPSGLDGNYTMADIVGPYLAMGGDLTLGLAQAYYERMYYNTSDIFQLSITSAEGGFNMNYTLASVVDGNGNLANFDHFISTEAFEYGFNYLISQYADVGQNGGWDEAITKAGVVNDGLGAAYSATEALAGGGIILTNKLSKASNVMDGIKIIKNVPAIGVIGTVSDALDVGLDFYNGDYGKAALKGGILILKNTIRFSSPMGFALITLIDLGVSAYDLYNDANDD